MPLVLNPDSTVVVTVKGEPVVLREPTLHEVAEMHKLLSEADAALPVPEGSAAEATTARLNAIYYSDEPPYAVVMQRVILMLTGRDVPLDDLPPWSKNPTTVARMIVHWQDPLPG